MQCRSRLPLVVFAVTLGILLSSCKKDEQASAPLAKTGLFERGKIIYMVRCTACHNMNPKFAGSLGPEIFGSKKELIEKRVLEAKYPDGYTPKRNSKIMTPLPDLKNDIEALHEYLNNTGLF